MNKNISDTLLNLPDSPGVYIFKNNKSKVIYVGKAKVLKNRVKSYFNKSDDNRAFYRYLLEHIAKIDWLVTNTEQEALLLENSLIKQFKPKYNIELKDDKNFYSVRIDLKSKFPRIELVRSRKKDSASYFGPFTSPASLKKTIHHLNKTFQLRTCSDQELQSRQRACILFQIGRCSAPCVQKISQEKYTIQIKRSIEILKGQSKELLLHLNQEMQEASDKMQFELAAGLRDLINAIKKTNQGQVIVDNELTDKDVIAYVNKAEKIYIQCLFIRDGIIRSYLTKEIITLDRNPEDLFTDFLSLFYHESEHLPKQIIVPFLNENIELIESSLNQNQTSKTVFHCPQKGFKAKLLGMATKNAEEIANTLETEHSENKKALELLQNSLNLKKLPLSIECYDISNIQGSDNVASGVAMLNGKLNKKMYRKYKIKTVNQADDFASLYEVITRRVQKGITEDNLPDLFLIDGGKGQLSSAYQALMDCGQPEIDIISIAKARTEKGTVDRFFKVNAETPVYLPENSRSINYLINLRDEAHRFAITFHRKLRGKKFKEDPLHNIPGIGSLKRQALLRHFGNIGAIRLATIDELLKVKGINQELAEKIQENLKL